MALEANSATICVIPTSSWNVPEYIVTYMPRKMKCMHRIMLDHKSHHAIDNI